MNHRNINIQRAISTAYRSPNKPVFWGWVALILLAIIAPVLPYSTEEIDLDAGSMAPPLTDSPSGMHWLGTDAVGRDVLSAMLNGIHDALLIGLLSALIAGIIGFSLGLLSGLWGDRKARINPVLLIGGIIAVTFGLHHGHLMSEWTSGESNSLFLHLVGFILFLLPPLFYLSVAHWLLGKIRISGSSFTWRPGRGIILLTDVVRTIPSIYLLLALLIWLPTGGIPAVAVVIGITSWPAIAIAINGEALRASSGGYYESAVALGYKKARVVLREVLPNVMPVGISVLVAGVGTAILAESYLAFLGVSPVEKATWGTLIADARSIEGWWLAVFPGTILFCTLWLVYQTAFMKPLRKS